jgi:hypothetical protein
MRAMAQVVECRFFGGLSIDETAEALNIRRQQEPRMDFLRAPGCTASWRRRRIDGPAALAAVAGPVRGGWRATGVERERLLLEHERTDSELVEQVCSLLAAGSGAAFSMLETLQPQSVAQVVKETVPARIGATASSGKSVAWMGGYDHAERDDGRFSSASQPLIATPDADDPLHKRFLDERQILAGLVHPHIARLLDGGIPRTGGPTSSWSTSMVCPLRRTAIAIVSMCARALQLRRCARRCSTRTRTSWSTAISSLATSWSPAMPAFTCSILALPS